MERADASARPDGRNSAARPYLRRSGQSLFRSTDFLYLGRGIHFPIALEGALKLKEISYIHAEGYPAGEMKHGPNALIDENLPVVVLATRDLAEPNSRLLYEKTLSNIQEVKAREGKVIAVACEGDEEVGKIADHVIAIPTTNELLLPILEVVPLQLLAYHIAVRRDVMSISRGTWPRASPSNRRCAVIRLEIRTRGKGLILSRAKWRMGGFDQSRDRPADAVHPAHLGVAGDSGECRSGRGAGPGRFLRTTRSREDPRYRHDTEGPDDMPAHIRSALTQTSLRFR